MKGLAAGTLIVDAEANFWLGLIKLPNYRPIWRWHYAKIWDKTGGQGTERTRSLARKIGYANVALVAVVVLVLVFSNIHIQFVPGVPTATKVTVSGRSSNLLFQFQSNTTGWIFYLENTTDFAHYNLRRPEGYVLLTFLIERTDPAFETRPIMLNLTSSYFYENATAQTFISNVAWAIENQDTGRAETHYLVSEDGFFGLPYTIKGRSTLLVGVLIGMRSFIVGEYTDYFSFQVTGGDQGSKVYVSGGYIDPRPR